MRLVKLETMFTLFNVCLGFRNVATDKMAEFVKVFNIGLTITANNCIFIITIIHWLII